MSYGSRTYEKRGAHIASVEADSPAARVGIQAGEYVQSINGSAPLDIIDWLWASADDELELDVSSSANGGEVRRLLLKREAETSWGLDFTDTLFDGLRLCKNDCSFCFMKQLPPGLRPALSLRDDDYRLSFLQGNFITLTNLSAVDMERIRTLRLSPLYVSFHAADPDVRLRMMGRGATKALSRLDELIAADISVHIQIVLVPGLNDGAVLDETLRYLSQPARREHIASVGIVPVAHTDQGIRRATGSDAQHSPADYTDPQLAQAVISQVCQEQFRQRETTGKSWVYLADEFYIYANAPFPLPEYYDDFPQYNNGIGIVLNFVSDIRAHYAELCGAIQKLPAGSECLTLVTGELACETLRGALSALEAGGRLRLLPVRNRFFGGTVSVTGLLTAGDILAACRYDREHLDALTSKTSYLVPDAFFNTEALSLDGCRQDEMEALAKKEGLDLLFYDTSVTGFLAAINHKAQELSQRKAGRA